MSYEVVELAVQTAIRASSSFEDEEVSVGDWKPLAAGLDKVCILEYGGFTSRVESMGGGYTTFWTVRANLYARYLDDIGLAHNVLRDARQVVINQIRGFPSLDGAAGVLFALPRSGNWSDPQEVQIGNVSYLREHVNIEVEEQETVTNQE